MPKFELKEEKAVVGQKATFNKESDYKVVTLNSDPTNKERLLHVIQADRLIKNGKAKEVKGAKTSVKPEASNRTITQLPK